MARLRGGRKQLQSQMAFGTPRIDDVTCSPLLTLQEQASSVPTTLTQPRRRPALEDAVLSGSARLEADVARAARERGAFFSLGAAHPCNLR